MPRRGARKVQKRIDAAIDALKQLGFSAAVIRKTVNNLLKEYGGDDGWPFIEEGSYKLVIEKILEDQEEEQMLLLKDKEDEGENRGGAGPLEVLEQAIHDCDANLIETSADTPALGSIDWKDISCMDYGSRNVLPSLCQNAAPTQEGVGGPSNVSSDVGPSHVQQLTVPSGPRSPSNIQQLKPRRKPCYGWISESESEDEIEGSQFIANVGLDKNERISKQCRERKRKSGWDVKPLGMY